MKKRMTNIFQCSMIIMLISAFISCSSTSTTKKISKANRKVVIMGDDKVDAVLQKPKVVVLVFEDLHFDYNKYTLNKKAKEVLNRNMKILKDNPGVKVRIAGYTSAFGSDKSNQLLSENRAAAVKKFLIKKEIVSPGNISIIGYGANNPAIHEEAPKKIYSKEAKANMRVLFEIVEK